MPGPFPGMDPYLEDPAGWQGTHNSLIAYMEAALNAVLPVPYAAYTEVRCYLETREAFLTIRDVRRENRVITTIEILSPANKTTRNEGRRLYQEKQQKILESDTHLIEIDLLRAGRHTVAVPESAFRPEHRYDYLVCLHRTGTQVYDVWLNSVRQRLPRVAVPLEAGMSDIELDLQAVFDQSYDGGAYLRKIDYREPLVPPLSTLSE